jgi:glycine/D-amino acid oxidase-like deaminating enzyme
MEDAAFCVQRQVTRSIHSIWNQPEEITRPPYPKAIFWTLADALWRMAVEGVFDVIVVGLGAMGSAAAYQLSKRGAKVLGLEAFTPAHDKGSSHGESRIIRQAYFEDPAYVPLVLRAYELWDQLQEESNKNLMRITGGVAIGPRDGTLVTGCLRSATTHGLGHELFDSNEMRRRFPQFALAEDEVAFYEEKAGYLKTEECIRQHLRFVHRSSERIFFRRTHARGRYQDGDSKRCYEETDLPCQIIGAFTWVLVRGTGTRRLDAGRRLAQSQFWPKPLRQSSSIS